MPLDLSQKCPKLVGESQAAVLEREGFARQVPCLFNFRSELSRLGLACLDVRLIKGVDSQNGARDGGRQLPAKEFLSQRVRALDVNSDNRMSIGLQKIKAAVGFG